VSVFEYIKSVSDVMRGSWNGGVELYVMCKGKRSAVLMYVYIYYKCMCDCSTEREREMIKRRWKVEKVKFTTCISQHTGGV